MTASIGEIGSQWRRTSGDPSLRSPVAGWSLLVGGALALACLVLGACCCMLVGNCWFGGSVGVLGWGCCFEVITVRSHSYLVSTILSPES
eukprot:scaffold16426_cov109-Isochrysis_galbana.AAC.8